MDIFLPIVLCVIFFLLFSICGWCCKRKRDGVVHRGPNITITSEHVNQSPVVVPPYPVTANHPMPAPAPGPGFVPQQHPYPVQGYYPHPAYPPPHGGPMPYPPTQPQPYPPTAGYPPNEYQSQPPPYNVAVAHPPVQPPLPEKEGYAKQAPYNPGYSGY